MRIQDALGWSVPIVVLGISGWELFEYWARGDDQLLGFAILNLIFGAGLIVGLLQRRREWLAAQDSRSDPDGRV